MTDLNTTQFGLDHSVRQLPEESLFTTWLRALDTVPPGHCGPIYIR